MLTYIVGLVSLPSLTLIWLCQLCPKTCAVVQVKVRSVIVFLIFFFVSCGLFTFYTWRNSCWNSVVQVHKHSLVIFLSLFSISPGHCIGLCIQVRDQLGSTPCTALRVTTYEQVPWFELLIEKLLYIELFCSWSLNHQDYRISLFQFLLHLL